jgi:alpha-glucosidase (family GH31 glycosyl hydrolase)
MNFRSLKEILLTPYPAVTFTTIGGIIDLFLFTGPTPKNVIQKYSQLVGLPFLPPYFALGYQNKAIRHLVLVFFILFLNLF